MEITELIKQIFEICLLPLLGALTSYIILIINKKTKELDATTDNELYKKYLHMLENTVVTCIVATNQTYVDSLKKEGKFDLEAQKIAFQKTYTAVYEILTDEAKVYLTAAVGDLDTYITNLIESQVKLNKTE